MINARTRKRQLVYAELDANAKRASDRMLLIHPGKNFAEGERYIVALRGLRTAAGRRIKASHGLPRAQARRPARSACAPATAASSGRCAARAWRRAG